MGRAGGPARHVTARVAPLGSRLVLALVEDRTRERRVEAVRRDFVANVSHELKTPVGAIRLLAEAVPDAADDPEAVKRFADRMLTESDRLTRLVQQIIELSRLQADDPLETPTAVSIDDVIGVAVDTSAIDATPSASTIVTGGTPGLEVLGNEEQVTAAVANLVANAVSYSAEDSTVLVTTKADDDIVEISVVDQGIGIPPSEIDRIFERFYRVDPARHRSTGGTGLGLSIVKHVAATHGGEVRVWSVEGQGSTFTLTLPQHLPHGQLSTPSTPSPAEGGTRVTRVLVVEDEESYSEALAYMLRKEGFEVAIAADGNAALIEFDRNGADIVLLDLMLPGHPRHRGVPHDPADLQRPGDHGQRQGRRGRQGGRARARRRRLRHQALLPARARRPDPRRAAPRHGARPGARRPSRPARCGWTSSATSSPSTARSSGCRSRSSSCSRCSCATPAGCSPAAS